MKYNDVLYIKEQFPDDFYNALDGYVKYRAETLN